jgi:hypothetical protein
VTKFDRSDLFILRKRMTCMNGPPLRQADAGRSGSRRLGDMQCRRGSRLKECNVYERRLTISCRLERTRVIAGAADEWQGSHADIAGNWK